MPPLSTPATAVLFMIVFFAVMMGIPLLALRLGHHRLLYLVGVGPRSHRPHTLSSSRGTSPEWQPTSQKEEGGPRLPAALSLQPNKPNCTFLDLENPFAFAEEPVNRSLFR
jgi:hypothetical protein